MLAFPVLCISSAQISSPETLAALTLTEKFDFQLVGCWYPLQKGAGFSTSQSVQVTSFWILLLPLIVAVFAKQSNYYNSTISVGAFIHSLNQSLQIIFMRDLSLARAAWSRIPLLGTGGTQGRADPGLNCKTLVLFRLIPRLILITWAMWFPSPVFRQASFFLICLWLCCLWRAGANNCLTSYKEQGMGIVMGGDGGLTWYWLSHSSWQDHSQVGQSAGLFWQHLSPLVSTYSWESFWKGALDLSVANKKMIYYVSVWCLISFFPCSGKSGALCSRGALLWSQSSLSGCADVDKSKSSIRAASKAGVPGTVLYHLHPLFTSKLMFWFMASDILITVSESSF